ncbi:MAG: hypothetical protein Q7T37_00675 [bacterium]|nr:hypothetical protein [bacterium]MDO8741931.1 hypothetical protein [bacterium]
MQTDLQLDEEKDFSRPVEVPKPSPFVQFVLTTGIVKTEKNAENLLLVFAVICVLVTLLLVLSGISKPAVNPFREGQNVLLPPEGGVRP